MTSSVPTFSTAALREAYKSFLGAAAGHVLLTGHSHQAWPDAAKEALARCFDDAARFVDEKWGEAVFPLADRVGSKILARLGFAEDDPITFGSNTHELVYRLLSALPRDARVVTTTSEFHSAYRQLSRLAEDGLRVTWVPGFPRPSLTDRLVAAISAGADLAIVSGVFFEDSFILPGLREVAGAARKAGALLLVDAYHGFNVAPLELDDDMFVTAGGYKYAQFGEGVCFLRSPRSCALRPRSTGWFADFGSLEAPRDEPGRTPVRYGDKGARFGGATFDPSGLYRAEAALGVFDSFGLDVPALRRISVAQTERIVAALDRAGIEVLSSHDPARRAGFVSARATGAHDVARRLKARGVHVDARGEALRLGPAPYVTDDEIDRGVAAAIEEIRAANP
ncbi:MAG: aminotransferase class V-fold PLP-dependent enzyme [Polyangiaceae bacterium]|nr:aminotransferase class V-fold PLP-dependent enzyme [Polyangiaceae bacterium]